MNSTVPRYPNRPSALRQRGPRADVCASHVATLLARPPRHRDYTTAPLPNPVSAQPASNSDELHPTRLSIPAYQSP